MFLYIKIVAGQKRAHTPKLRMACEGGRHVVQASNNNIQATIKDRRAYPGSYCRTLPDGVVILGYGPLQPKEGDEFLHVALWPSGAIRITRDLFCTLPLFYGTSSDMVVISNDFAQVVAHVPTLTVNVSAVARLFHDPLLKEPYTIWNEIGILGERETLQWADGILQHIPSTSRPWTFSSELPATNPREFPRLLEDHFTQFSETRLTGGAIGFELSGGLDSSFLPLFLAKNGHILNAQASSMIYADPKSRQRQLQKIGALEAVTGLHSKKIFMTPEKHYPLAGIFGLGNYRPFHFMHELYEQAVIEMAEHFRAMGVKVVVTGGGGDQILEHRPHPALLTQENLYRKLPPPLFLTDACHKLFQLPDPFAALGTLLSPGIIHEQIARSNIYIDRDIWPVSPFHSVKLFNFCQALPVQFRVNKNIFRAYFEASRFPTLLFCGDNEDFGNFFENCWRSAVYEPLMLHLSKQSVLQRLGLVDLAKLHGAFNTAKIAASDIDQLHDIYVWLVLECNLQWSNTTTRKRSIYDSDHRNPTIY